MKKVLQMKKNSRNKVSLIVLVVLFAIVSFIGIFSPIIDRKAKDVLLSFGVVGANNSLMVHFISVGQGDAIAINLPDGKIMLIDTGTRSSSALIKYLNEKVLNTRRDKRIDYLVLTHSHEDHIGGAVSLINSFNVNFVYMPVVEADSQIYTSLKDIVEDKSIEYTTDYNKLQTTTDSYSINVFGPLDLKNSNNSCPIIKLTYLGYSFLFTGDIEASAETNFVNTYGELLNCDILKVAHHGSNTSSTIEFLTCVTPTYAVISCGVNNIYKHPNEETLASLTQVGAKVYRTDLLGDIMFVASKDYGLVELDGNYVITALEFKFIYVVLIVNTILVINIIVILCYTHSKHSKIKKLK